MAGTDIADNLLTGGTNQGIDRAVLPMPQLNIAFNARLRKGSRWGKRYGHAALSSTIVARCVGGSSDSGFVVDGDACSNWDQTTGAFVNPAQTAAPGVLYTPRVPGAVSGFIPDTSYFPVPPRAVQSQITTPCACAYAFGYLWSVIQYVDPVAGADSFLRIVGTNQADQTVAYMQDLFPSVTLQGGLTYPRLMLVGSNLVLTCMQANVGAKEIRAYAMNSAAIATGFVFGATLYTGAGITTYDASTYSSTEFILGVYATGGGNTTLARVTASTMAIAASVNAFVGVVQGLSVAGGASTTRIYVAYGVAAGVSVAVYTATFAFVGGGALSTFTGVRPLICETATGIRVVHEVIAASGPGYGLFTVRDVSNAGAVSANSYRQTCMYPLSAPFLVNGNVYIWCKSDQGASYGYPALIRLVAPASLDAGALYATGGAYFRAPIEMSVQDYAVSAGPSATVPDIIGLPMVAGLGVGAGASSFALLYPAVISSAGPGITAGHEFRMLQASTWSRLGTPLRSTVALYADSSAFLPMGALTRVDDRGPTEEGFVYPPAILNALGQNPGAMTASATYYYTAVYKSRGTNGRYEVSAPAKPVAVTLTAAQHSVNVGVPPLGCTARPALTVEFYRTLANGQTFYLCGVADGASVTSVGITDVLADTVVATQPALYTQVGQQLPNAFPPASRFGCVGGGRVFLGGLMRPDLVQASKLIFGDQSPSFCDSDAFRIVVPAPVTGVAWMDVLTIFTGEGIYIASGDGPTDDGVGDFGNLTRMPYELGCIEPRSIRVVDDGCFFQTSRGLYLLPRGFGAPQPAGDNVMDSLASFPVITGSATITKAQEQSIIWTCSNAAGTLGVRLVYDLAHKVWSVDNFVDLTGAGAAPLGIGQWLGGEIAQFGGATIGLQASNSGFADTNNTPIAMQLRTGDLRPFGVVSEGVISKMDMLAEVRSACTLSIDKTTDKGTIVSSRVFALAAGDYQIGDMSITETELGNAELRDVSSLRVQYAETSTSEGLALVALSMEHEQGEGLKRVSDLSRNT